MAIKKTTRTTVRVQADPSKSVVTHEKLLAVPFHTQQPRVNWCWAACAQMIFEFLGFHSAGNRQCEFAKTVYGPNCCSSSLPPGCDDTGVIAGCFYRTVGFPFCFKSGALSYQQVITELHDHDRPVQVLWYRSGSQGHYVLIVGNYDSDQANGGKLRVLDPKMSSGFRTMEYSDVVSNGAEGNWKDTFYQLDQSPASCVWHTSWCS